MRILIVEDEELAAAQLKDFATRFDPSIQIVGSVSTCKALANWLVKNIAVDLIFCDLELADGNVLPTLAAVHIPAPIIFTTAYYNYWNEALKLNGIDYLLKPLTEQQVHAALKKLEVLKQAFAKEKNLWADQLAQLTKLAQPRVEKKRFAVRLNNELFILEDVQISFFRIADGVIFAHTGTGKRFPLSEGTMNELEEKLSPVTFFRINRSEIVNASFIHSVRIHNSGEYAIMLKEQDEKLVVSQSRSSRFKEWLGQ